LGHPQFGLDLEQNNKLLQEYKPTTVKQFDKKKIYSIREAIAQATQENLGPSTTWLLSGKHNMIRI
jgi:hypothetical protein